LISKKFDEEIGDLGDKMFPLHQYRGEDFKTRAWQVLWELQIELLDYKFNNPNLLLTALTHPSGRNFFNLENDYEKLEALGDAILDYMININMMRLTMFERYLPQHSQPNLSKEQAEYLKLYQVNPDYQPGDAHQAKLKLAKNELLSKMTCLWGLHRYCLFYDHQDS
jgi:dsRNA-specific ribonuclease